MLLKTKRGKKKKKKRNLKLMIAFMRILRGRFRCVGSLRSENRDYPKRIHGVLKRRWL